MRDARSSGGWPPLDTATGHDFESKDRASPIVQREKYSPEGGELGEIVTNRRIVGIFNCETRSQRSFFGKFSLPFFFFNFHRRGEVRSLKGFFFYIGTALWPGKLNWIRSMEPRKGFD